MIWVRTENGGFRHQVNNFPEGPATGPFSPLDGRLRRPKRFDAHDGAVWTVMQCAEEEMKVLRPCPYCINAKISAEFAETEMTF